MSKKIAALKMSDEETLYHLLVKEHGYYRAILEITQLESEKLKYNYSNDKISPLLFPPYDREAEGQFSLFFIYLI